ncbi:MAG TPA: twin-arginine translocase subunit TatC [Gemmatimonadales bacterium]|nr:twin-arginine translocase subunit TatC [Gemmatimonadales bacterium]
MAERDARGEMPFLDHLEELRWRILYSLLAIIVGTLVGWVVVEHVDIIGLLMRPVAPLLHDQKLVFTSPTEPFFITLKFAFAVGCLLASPVVVYHVWAFLAPALYLKERRVIMPAFSVGIVLFLAGASVAYLWVLPRALKVLFGFQSAVLTPFITADAYFGFAAQICIAFGLITELPLVVIILASLGLVTPQFLARHRRYALVLSAVVAALLTPPDAVSMLLMLLPLTALYEVSIWCAWVVTRRRARREASAAGPAGSAGAATLLLLLVLTLAGGLSAQVGKPPPRDTTRADSLGRLGRAAPTQPVDTAAARRLGLPTGPSRSFPQADSVLDSLLRLPGFQITRYVADTLLVRGDSQAMSLWGGAYLQRDTTRLEADSIHYLENSCRLDATGAPKLFDQATVLVGEGMRYDTCIRRGTVTEALTDFQQGGATWFLRGTLAVDSGSTRVYGANSEITSSDWPVPEYHFSAKRVKWLNKSVMVARPAVLYVRDVPIVWMPFLPMDIRTGRRSGFLAPGFGLNDLVRPTRSYQRHVADLGYYFVINDYLDALASLDWYAGRNVSLRGQMHYKWLDRFVTGSIGYTRLSQFDGGGTSSRIQWSHAQRFSSRSGFNANVDYATSANVVRRNSLDPNLVVASLGSQVSYSKTFDWGTLNMGGSRHQELGNGLVTQTFPTVTLTPAAVNVGDVLTWSPSFSFTNTQSFHNNGGALLIGPLDTLHTFFDNRATDIAVGTPLRIGRWNWSNNLSIDDQTSNARREFDIPDSTAPGGVRHQLYTRTFSTAVDWQTGINLPLVFARSWKLQPGVQILNSTTGGPFMLRNQFSGGQFVTQGKRLAFSASMAPTVFGFFPGIGPLERIRHSFAPSISYLFAPSANVPAAYSHALDPADTTLNAKSDPQQTITVGLSQNFEGKLRPAAGDTSGQPGRKIRLLSISTSGISYNFEQAKQPHRTGWATSSLSNTFASDLLPGFSLSMTHSLWKGTVGTDSARFDPFLTGLNASFSLSARTFRSLGALFGLGRGAAPAAGPATGVTPPPPGIGGGGAFPMTPGSYGGGGGGGGAGFSLGVSFSSTRQRRTPGVVIPKAGQQILTLNGTFSPTAHWNASWNTRFDLGTRQFQDQQVNLERDLHRWHATFSFNKTVTGNFAFTFLIRLLDQPDIKFDYRQQSYVQ